MLTKSRTKVFLLTLFFSFLAIYWFYSIGTKLQFTNKPKFNIPLLIFKISAISPIPYIIYTVNNTLSGHEFNLPLHFGIMLMMFYVIIYAAKTLKTAELKRETSISEYLDEVFLLWFYPIGIWFIQPRIQKIINKKNEVQQVI